MRVAGNIPRRHAVRVPTHCNRACFSSRNTTLSIPRSDDGGASGGDDDNLEAELDALGLDLDHEGRGPRGRDPVAA